MRRRLSSMAARRCAGTSTSDPVGATFDEVYNGGFHYLLWNDQFHDLDPNAVLDCSGGDCGSPWGHSKGMLAWNDAGEGFVMQVSTPSWPGSGSPQHPRMIHNTLGCIEGDDDVGVSQHFFALRLTEPDLVKVINGLQEASVATDPNNPQVAGNLEGSPDEVLRAIKTLGVRSKATTLDPAMPITLSSGVKFIAKPSGLHVPPWQMISAELGSVPPARRHLVGRAIHLQHHRCDLRSLLGPVHPRQTGSGRYRLHRHLGHARPHVQSAKQPRNQRQPRQDWRLYERRRQLRYLRR